MDIERPDPDRLIDLLKAEEAQAKRGKLKIFFGASAGVGKTYAMLDDARSQMSVLRLSSARSNIEQAGMIFGTLGDQKGRNTAQALLTSLNRRIQIAGIGLMLLMGFSSFNDPLQSLLPAAIYRGLHTLEGQIVTPIVLGKRMALSPLVLILALMVFGWLWGIVGLLLAVPLLVCVKIVLTRIEGLDGWARLLE